MRTLDAIDVVDTKMLRTVAGMLRCAPGSVERNALRQRQNDLLDERNQLTRNLARAYLTATPKPRR